jgi:AraC-like DNA-binding protein
VAAWTKATDTGVATATASTAGLLHPDEFARHVELDREPAGRAVERWVENHWSLRWELPAGRWFVSQVLPHPACSLTAERGSHPRPAVPPGDHVVITGVITERFDTEVRGWGRVLGLKFRPGGLAALTGRPAHPWTDRTVPAADVLPAGLSASLGDPELLARPADWREAAEAGLAALGPDGDERYDQLLAVVADMLADRTLLTVADVGERHGLAPRTLQRLFLHYVGVGPKAVLARYRMHDAVSDLDEGYDGTLTDLAHRHGWYDQAHFTRDFTALVGLTPGQYRERLLTARSGQGEGAGDVGGR